ncbi:MAG: glycosyltransferase family 4 protein [Candidatus Vogelbacteria bacterium]|nr:glycosyltransferase family 4 protein [Candidatus Vogelbacteria bacterium]
MHVLMFGWELPPHNSGGLGTACEGLLRGFRDQDVFFTFVLPRRVSLAPSSPNAKIVFAEDAASLGGLKWPDASAYASPDGERAAFGLLEEVRRYALWAGQMASELHFDIIHAHDWLSFGAGMAAREATGKPLVVHVHATEFDRTGGAGVNQTVYDIEREGMERADRIIAVSNYTKDTIVRRYGIPPEKIAVVHNGVTVEESKPPPRQKRRSARLDAVETSAKSEPLPLDLSALKRSGAKLVLFLGRITLQKGPDYFLKAAQGVLAIEPNVYFILAGSGDMERQMILQAARAGISDRVIFAGFVRGNERTALYRAADLYIMPSVSEPFGIAPLEAMAEGTPVLISKQSGVSEAVRHALKVDFWDTDEMVNKIIGVLRSPALTATLRVRGKNEARKNTWERAAEKVYSVYRSILDYIREISI